MNTNMVAKYYFQWFQLVLVHALVFWYFPLIGNNNLNDSVVCHFERGEHCNGFT